MIGQIQVMQKLEKYLDAFYKKHVQFLQTIPLFFMMRKKNVQRYLI